MITVNIENAKQIAIKSLGNKSTPELIAKILACSTIEEIKLCCL